MAKLVVNTGTTPNDGTGDSLFAGAGKINSNFSEIYSFIGDGTTLGIASFSQVNVSGASTFAGITTVTGVTLFARQLSVSGVSTHVGISTFQSTLFTNQFSVSGVSTFAGITTVTGVSLFTRQLSVAGVLTATSLIGQVNSGVATITTLGGTNVTYTTGNFTTGNIVTGVVTNISGTNLNYTGISTVGSLSIGSTQVISSGRQLQNIASLDATTTATIESAIANAPNTFTDINVSGLSTFAGITTVTGVSLFSRQLSVSGVSTFAGITTNTSTLFVNQLSVAGVSTFNNNIVVTGISSVGIGTTNLTERLSILGRTQILQDSLSSSRLVFRATPGNSYRWNLDNDSGNLFRIFREDDATSANGAVVMQLDPFGGALITGVTTVGLAATSTPPNNSQMSFELTSNTNLRIKVRGTDGVLRSANITLA